MATSPSTRHLTFRSAARRLLKAGRLGERGLVGEELQAVGVVRGGQLFQEQATEEAREHPDGEKEAGPAGNPALAVWR